VILSLDDIAFHGNQCEFHPFDSFVVTATFAFGFTVRASDNRFKESAFRVKFSAVAVGLASTVAGNQSTHCLRAVAFQPILAVKDNNSVLIDPTGVKYCAGT
jgi:hypothetical protein